MGMFIFKSSFAIRSIRLTSFLLFLCTLAYGQQGNTVTGQVTGYENRPIYDATVELLDDYARTVAYTKTDGSGRYFFSGVRAGRFSVRVRTIEPEYEEQVLEEEIVNFTRQGLDGSQTQSGTEHKQLDFRLRIRKEFLGVTAALFVQEIPPNAKKLYDQAILDIGAKKEKEGLAFLK
jgi:hypothetical protein